MWSTTDDNIVRRRLRVKLRIVLFDNGDASRRPGSRESCALETYIPLQDDFLNSLFAILKTILTRWIVFDVRFLNIVLLGIFKIDR